MKGARRGDAEAAGAFGEWGLARERKGSPQERAKLGRHARGGARPSGHSHTAAVRAKQGESGDGVAAGSDGEETEKRSGGKAGREKTG